MNKTFYALRIYEIKNTLKKLRLERYYQNYETAKKTAEVYNKLYTKIGLKRIAIVNQVVTED